MSKSIAVVGAVILSQGKVLCAQRGPDGQLAGQWEFPGGKIEPGEAPREALQREIDEELNCRVTVGELVTSTRHEYEFATVNLTTYWCTLDRGVPVVQEHGAIAWLTAEELSSRDWAPADVPAVGVVQSSLRESPPA